MGFILLDPPWEANESPEGLERWIAELNSMEEEYGADPEIRGQIREEREHSQRILAELTRQVLSVPRDEIRKRETNHPSKP